MSLIVPEEIPAAPTTPAAAAPVEPAAPAGPVPILEAVDKRFHVLNADGTPNHDEMLRKQAKSYAEAEKLIQTRKNRAPDAYDPKAIADTGVEVTDEVLGEFKTLDLSQDQAAGVTKLLAAKVIPAYNEKIVSLEKELLAARWGIDDPDSVEFKTRFQTAARWAIDNLGEAAAKKEASTAKGFLALEKQMKVAMKDTSVNVKTQGTAAGDPLKARQRLNEIARMPEYYSGRDKALIAEADQCALIIQKAA